MKLRSLFCGILSNQPSNYPSWLVAELTFISIYRHKHHNDGSQLDTPIVETESAHKETCQNKTNGSVSGPQLIEAPPRTTVGFTLSSPLPTEVSRLKEEGGRYFKLGNYNEAVGKYPECIDALETGKILTIFKILLVNA